MYKWFLAARYLYTKRIAVFGVASVMLCVAMVLVVLSVMGGFLDTVRQRARGLHSEIVLDGASAQGFPYYQEFGQYLHREMPEVVELTTPVVHGYGIFRVPCSDWTKPVTVLGIRLDDYVKVNDFANGLHYEKYYPGTTNLKPQSLPVAGLGADGELRLPEPLEAANAKWRQSETDVEVLKDFLEKPFQNTYFPRVMPPAGMAGERVFAVSENPPHFEGPARNGIIVGCDVINQRRSDGRFDRFYARGVDMTLALLPLTPQGNPLGEPPVKVPLRYSDDSRTGIYEIDSLCVYVDFDLLQQKLAMDALPLVDGGFTKPRSSQLFIDLKDGVDINEARGTISDAWLDFNLSLGDELSDLDAQLLGYVRVMTWEDMQREFIAAVEKEKVLVTFLFSLISVVAIVLLGCIFYMIVEKKTKDIGILKSIGASSVGVAGLFIVYAGAIGLIGSILGTALGSTVVWYINDIQDWLASIHPQLRVWSPDVYSFDQIPNVVKRADAIWIASIAVVSSMIGSLIPARIAARVWPVAALRYE